MPPIFLNKLSSIIAISLSLAFIITIIVFGFTLFVIIFAYIFVPIFLIALIRWLWLKFQKSKQGHITYYDKE